MKWGIQHFFKNLYRVSRPKYGYYHHFNATSTIIPSYPTMMFLKVSIAATIGGQLYAIGIEDMNQYQYSEEGKGFFNEKEDGEVEEGSGSSHNEESQKTGVHHLLKLLSNAGQVSTIGLLTVLNCRKVFGPKQLLRIHDSILARPLEYYSIFPKIGGSIGLRVTLQYYLLFETMLTGVYMLEQNIPIELLLNVWVDNVSMDISSVFPMIGLGYIGGRLLGGKVGERASLFTTALMARGMDANMAASRYLHTAFGTRFVDVVFLQKPIMSRVLLIIGVGVSFVPQMYLFLQMQRDSMLLEHKEAGSGIGKKYDV